MIDPREQDPRAKTFKHSRRQIEQQFPELATFLRSLRAEQFVILRNDSSQEIRRRDALLKEIKAGAEFVVTGMVGKAPYSLIFKRGRLVEVICSEHHVELVLKALKAQLGFR
ncbi:MAG: hypothetical protein PVJ09_04320 [Candidatus Woesebacteria bacterium]|jgi:hypothetical protein